MNPTKPISWFRPIVDEAETREVLKVLESGYLNDGPVTRELESRIAKLIGVQHCVGVTSGTAAITLSLMAVGVGPGDEVLVPDMTFIATANAVRLAGAEVKLVDVRPNRFDIDPEGIKRALGPKVKAIVPVDVNGRGAAYEWLEPFCREHGLHLICDSAEALGSQYRSRYLGSFGQAGCFSFSANKTLTTGQGGMIATNEKTVYERLLELKDQGRRFQGTGGNDLHPVMGYNFKLTNLQAAVGLAQFEKLKDRLAQAQRRDDWYRSRLKGLQGIEFPDYSEAGEVRQWTDILVSPSLRDRIEKGLSERKIGCRPFWNPLHTQLPYKAADSDFKNSVLISERGLWLPSSFDLTLEQVEMTCDAIRKIIG